MNSFPDYEAASVAFIDKLKEIAPNNQIISLDVDMRMIVAAVDAALGDETLYRKARTGDKRMGIMAVCPVWSKEKDDG